MKNLYFTLAAIVLINSSQVFAQQGKEITMAQAVEFINKKLGNPVQIELEEESHHLLIKFFKNGTLYKIDQIYLETLDPNKISYSIDEKALIIRCKNAEELTGKFKKLKEGCVEREIIDKKTVGSYGRTTLEMENDKKKVTSLQKAFAHLIMLAQDPQYHSNIPFE